MQMSIENAQGAYRALRDFHNRQVRARLYVARLSIPQLTWFGMFALSLFFAALLMPLAFLLPGKIALTLLITHGSVSITQALALAIYQSATVYFGWAALLFWRESGGLSNRRIAGSLSMWLIGKAWRLVRPSRCSPIRICSLDVA